VPACEKTGSCHCLLCALSTFQNHITLPTAQDCTFTFTFIKWTHINLGAWPILGGCTPNPHSFAPISATPVYIIAYSVHVLVIQGHQNWYHSKIHMRLHTVTICLSSIVSEILRFTSAKICFFAVFTHPTLVFTLGSRVWKLASKN